MEVTGAYVDELEALQVSRRTALISQSAHRSCLNTSTAMPTEVLVAMFEQCVLADTSGHALSCRAMPWVLSQTCRRWRTIATSTPSLWRIIRLDTQKYDIRNRYASSLYMFRAWLERSKSLPISCLVILGEEPSCAQFNTEVVDLLIGHSARWYAASFCFGTLDDLFHRLRTVPSDLPLLRSIRVEVIIPRTSRGHRDIPMTWTAPNLREAAFLVFDEYGSRQPSLMLPWSQLEVFEWTPNRADDFLSISSTFTSLRYCYLQIPYHTHLSSSEHHTLPQLLRFDISGPYQSILAIMNHLSLPSLQCFSLDTHEQIGTVADHLLAAISRLQARSVCGIRHLSAPFSLFSSPNSTALAAKVDTIRELRVLLSVEEENAQAIINLRDTPIFPNLEVLHLLFREPPDEGCIFSDMADVIEARYSPQTSVRRLEKVSLDVIRPPEASDMRISATVNTFQRLLGLEKCGLVLLGSVVEGRWNSIYAEGCWTDEDMGRVGRYWADFGYSDWLYEAEIGNSFVAKNIC